MPCDLSSPSTVIFAPGYLVMDFLEGGDLTAYLDTHSGSIPVEEAIHLILPVLDALQVIHAEDIYHRDISPNNIMISRNDPVLIDFGAARQLIGERSHTLDVILTPGYSPFESYASKGNVGAWTDIYACGATLYRMITGYKPPDAIERIQQDELKPPTSLLPRHDYVFSSKRLDEVLLQALAVKIEDRFQSVDDFKTSLQQIVSSVPKRSIHTRESIGLQYKTICCNCMKDTEGYDPCPYCRALLTLENDPPALPVRTVLHDRYFIGKCLGRGKVSITYLALDLQVNRRVAIVAIKEYLPKNIAWRSENRYEIVTKIEDIELYEYGLKKFLQEARTIARFEGVTNIVRIWSDFKENNTAYFVMKYLEGKTLEQYMLQQHSGISEAELLNMMLAVFTGLKAVHDRGALHRDIKPSNIYLPDNGEPLLIGFGSFRLVFTMKMTSFLDNIYISWPYLPLECYSSV